ncbi:Rho GTPase activation protein [Umbelopsis sp. PMI_123]|nr:Rho GTPase activation protein [Umbelopsis sp. PMI_123]
MNDDYSKKSGEIMAEDSLEIPQAFGPERDAQNTLELIGKLSDLDSGLHCLLDKVKQDMQSTKDAMMFLKKRAALEEEYGKQMTKLAQSMAESFEKAHPRAGSYGDAWTSILKVHEKIGEQHIKFSTEITEVADDLQLLFKDTEKSRKQAKEQGLRHERLVTDADLALEKAKQKYELHSEQWEQSILLKNNEPSPMQKKALFKSNKTQAQLDRTEEEARAKAAASDQTYRQQLNITNATRAEYFKTHLPNSLTNLKSIGDECNVALRYQLARYAYIYEQALTADGYALDNDDGLGLRSLTEKIDKDADLEGYIKQYGGRASRTQKTDIPYKEYSMSKTAKSVLNPNPVFGVDLALLMERDREEVPVILRKCAEAVETYGLNTVGIYRVSGTNTQIQKLKTAFDRDCRNVNLNAEENVSDINNITSVLKLWFRELPDPLFPRAAYQHFLNAAKIDDERMRVLGLHSIINDLPDANYATLKFLMNHLDRVQQSQRHNKMGISNLATIFGLTLMGNDTPSVQPVNVQAESLKLAETQWQVRVVQTILENYRVIFEPDDE